MSEETQQGIVTGVMRGKLRDALMDERENPVPYRSLQALSSFFGISAVGTRGELRDGLLEFLDSRSGAGDEPFPTDTDKAAAVFDFLSSLAAHTGDGPVGLDGASESPSPGEVVVSPAPEVVEDAAPVASPVVEATAPAAVTEVQSGAAGVNLSAVPEKWRRFVSRCSPHRIERIREMVRKGSSVPQLRSGREIEAVRANYQGKDSIVAFFWEDVLS